MNQAMPRPSAGHCTHHSPGDVIRLMTNRNVRIIGAMNRNFTEPSVLQDIVVSLLASLRRGQALKGSTWTVAVAASKSAGSMFPPEITATTPDSAGPAASAAATLTAPLGSTRMPVES